MKKQTFYYAPDPDDSGSTTTDDTDTNSSASTDNGTTSTDTSTDADTSAASTDTDTDNSASTDNGTTSTDATTDADTSAASTDTSTASTDTDTSTASTDADTETSAANTDTDTSAASTDTSTASTDSDNSATDTTGTQDDTSTDTTTDNSSTNQSDDTNSSSDQADNTGGTTDQSNTTDNANSTGATGGNNNAAPTRPYTVESWRPLVTQLAGDIPVEVVLRWIKHESEGNPCSTGKIVNGSSIENGLFQLYSPDDNHFASPAQLHGSFCNGQTCTRDLTSAEANIQVKSGIAYINQCRDRAKNQLSKAGVSWDETGKDFWSLVKMQHNLPSIPALYIPKLHPSSWADFKQGVIKEHPEYSDGSSTIFTNAEDIGSAA